MFLLVLLMAVALFLFENFHSLLGELAKRETGQIGQTSTLLARQLMERFPGDLEAMRRAGVFARIDRIAAPLPSGDRPVPRLVRENDELWLAVALPETNGTHLDFTWDIRRSPLPLFQRLSKITSGVILALGFFLLISAGYLVYLFRRPRTAPGGDTRLPPLETYLADLQTQETALRDEVNRQTVSSREKEDLNQGIVQTIEAAVMYVSKAGRVEIFNPAAQEMFGQSYALARNNSPETVLHRFPELLELFQRAQGRISGEWAFGERWIVADIAPTGTGKLLIARDVTLERQRERILSQSRNFIMLGEMATALAHEIKNSLGTIYGYSRSIHSAPEKTSRIDGEVHYLTSLMESFLNFAKPIPEIRRQEFDLVEAVRKAAADAGLTADLPQTPRFFCGDPVLMTSILANLAGNAIQAGATRWRVAIEREGQLLTMVLADDGEGIAPELREKIWLPFFSTREAGTGMGLALVRKLLHAMLGEIELLPDPSPGSTFRITFYPAGATLPTR